VAILVLLQIAFGINSEQIIQQVIQSVEQIKDLAMDQLNN